MGLTLRKNKTEPLTIQEMDNNLLYIESLGVTDISKDGNKLVFERPNENTLEVTIDNNLPIVRKKILGSNETTDDTIIYEGVMQYSFDEPTTDIPLKYNISENETLGIEAVWGKSYFIDVEITNCLNNICSTPTRFQYPLYSNLNYDPNISESNEFIFGGGFVPFGFITFKDSDDKLNIRINTITNRGVVKYKLIETSFKK